MSSFTAWNLFRGVLGDFGYLHYIFKYLTALAEWQCLFPMESWKPSICFSGTSKASRIQPPACSREPVLPCLSRVVRERRYWGSSTEDVLSHLRGWCHRTKQRSLCESHGDHFQHSSVHLCLHHAASWHTGYCSELSNTLGLLLLCNCTLLVLQKWVLEAKHEKCPPKWTVLQSLIPPHLPVASHLQPM